MRPSVRPHPAWSWLALSGIAAYIAVAPGLLAQGTVEATSPSQNGQPQYTLRTRVPITIVDVTVTDSKGRPVHGLQQSDFTLLEDKAEMKIGSFDEHRTDEAAPTAAAPAGLKLPANTFTNANPAPPPDRPINILLIDNLNTPTGVQPVVQQQMLAYIKRMPPGTQMAVFGLTSRLFIVQGLTTDRDLLDAAILSYKNRAIAPPTEDLGQDTASVDTHSPPMPGDPCDETDTARTTERIQYTLGAMRQIARYLSGMPGRKNLIWLLGSSPVAWPPPMAAPKAGGPVFTPGICYDFADEFKAATDVLARAHVAINPIESRGLRTDINSNRKLLEEHYNMDLQADQTGGRAVYTSNDLASAVADAIDLGSNYYTLTYTPVNQTLDTRFRTISVKVDKPGLHLMYRNGYYAVAPDVDSRGKKIDSVTPMQAAMMRGALDATQILFEARAVPAAATETTVPASNAPDAKQMKPPYRRIEVSYVIDVHGIEFAPGPDGNYRGSFEYGVRVYNTDGDEIVNSTVKTVSPILPPAVYKSMLTGGANAHQEIDVPATGDYFLRVAVHDLTSGRVGSVEIPTASLLSEKP